MGLDLDGKIVLDIGFGTGGPAIALARDLGAGKVVGIDVEPPMLDKATKNIERARVADKIELKIVEPGPIPFDDDSFDVVFSKDSLVHIEDKPALFREILRVLKPGGVFAASDWLCGDGEDAIRALERYKELSPVTLEMTTAPQMEAILSKAGFENVLTRDRNAWFAKTASYDVQQLEGPLNQELVDAFGEEILTHWIKVKRALADAATAGGLRPTHLRGFKPVV
jgi:phosphoethanolamine N-methyltransferase